MEIMDVTLRESVYYGKGLKNEDALEYLRKLKENISSEWISYVEVGYINNDVEAPLHYNEKYLENVFDICKDTYKITAMMHVPKADMTRWNPQIIKKLDLVRVVVGHHVPNELQKYVDYLHKLGVKISVNITYIAGMEQQELIKQIERAERMGVDYIFCADSSGSFSQVMTKRVSDLLLAHCGKMVTGIHLHDHMQMALANAVTARDCGIAMTDVSVTGAGKGGGNLKMEQGLLALNGTENLSYELFQGLHNMIKYFAELIGRDGDFYTQNMADFLTGLYRLKLKDTDMLEKECGTDYDRYFRLVTQNYTPFETE